MANNVQITLLTDISQATKNVEIFTRQAVEGVNRVSDQFQQLNKNLPTDVFKGAFAADIAVKGLEVLGETFSKVVGIIKGGIDAAAKEEAALASLTEALRANGAATRENINAAEAFAEQLEKTTKFSSDAVLQAESLLASLTGLSGAGLNQATQAAADLATVLGTDLETAARKLAKAAQGGDEQMARLGLRFVKGANDVQTFQNILAAVERQLGGRAQAAANTFAGALAILSNAFENVEKAIGRFIIQSPALIGIFQTLISFTGQVTGFFKDNEAAIASFVNSTIKTIGELGVQLVAFGPTFVQIGKVFLSAFDGIGAVISSVAEIINGAFGADSTEGIGKVVQAVGLLTNSFVFLKDIAVESVKAIGNALTSIVAPIATVVDRFVRFTSLMNSGAGLDKASGVFVNLGKDIKDSFLEPLKDTEDGFAKAVNSFQANNSALSASIKASSKEAEVATTKFDALVKSIGEQRVTKTISVQLQSEGIFDKLLKGFSQVAVAVKGFFQSSDFAKALGGAFKGGAQGAQQLFGTVIDNVANAATKALSNIPIAGPIIAIVAELLKFLAQGKRIVMEQTKAFLEEAERIPFNILQALPALVSEILKRGTVQFLTDFIQAIPVFVTEFIQALVRGVPFIIRDLIANLPRVLFAIVTIMPRVAIALISALITEIPRTIPAIAAAFSEGIRQAFFTVQGAQQQVGGAVQGVGNLIGGLFGFADGGRVPDATQFNNDGGIAKVSSGEQILNKDLSDQLERFLNRQQQAPSSGAQNLTVTLVVGEQELANVLLNLNRNGFRVA